MEAIDLGKKESAVLKIRLKGRLLRRGVLEIVVFYLLAGWQDYEIFSLSFFYFLVFFSGTKKVFICRNRRIIKFV